MRNTPAFSTGQSLRTSANGSLNCQNSVPRARRSVHVAASAAAIVDERRVFHGPLPPTGAKATQLVTVKEGKLWSLRQDFPEDGDKSIWLNCSIAKLSNDSLLVYSPVAPTPEMLELVASLPGKVQHIVAPSLSPEHWLYVNAFSKSQPDATVWVCPGLLEVNLPGIGDAKIAPGPNVKVIGPEMEAALGAEVSFALYEGPFGLFKEVVMCAKHAGGLFSGDLFFGAFEDEGMPTGIQKKIGDLVGIRNQLGCPVAFLQMTLTKDRAQQWAQEVVGWEFDTVTGGHLSAGINKERYGVDGKEAFKKCFSFML